MAITHLLFDCDNTLVQSEDLAFEACAQLINELGAEFGSNFNYSVESLLAEFIGMNFRGMVCKLRDTHSWPLDNARLEDLVKLEEDRVISKIKEKGLPCEGCNEVLEVLQKDNKYGLAVVSSSALRRVLASIDKVGQDKYFPRDHVFSAATSLEVPTSKPDPAIYIHAAEVIGKTPSECLAIEDSRSGTKSAVDAGIPVLGYVGATHGKENQDKLAKVLTEAGAKHIIYHFDEFFDALKKYE